MKSIYGWISLFLAFIFLVLPLTSVKGDVGAQPVSSQIQKEEVTFRLKDKESGEISVITARDYILGVVSAEMPASYHIEALKAQTVAAYTFALWRKNENKKEDFDRTSDSNLDQAYINKEGRSKKWGEKEGEDTEKILSVNITTLTKKKILEAIAKRIKNNKRTVIFTPNPQILLCAQKSASHRRLLECADINIPDGIGIVIASKIKGGRIQCRVSGIDLASDILKIAQKKEYKILTV